MLGHEIRTTGTVFIADGTPLGGEEIIARVYSSRGTGGFIVSSEYVMNGSFYFDLDEFTTSATVAVAKKGCAVVFVGPFDAANMDRLKDLHVKLTPGYPAAVQIVNEAGRPVAGARLLPYYACPSKNELPLAETVTDADGRAVIEHVGEAPLSLRVLADGFQADEAIGLRLDPVKPYRWTLHPTTPLRGTITDAATGKPIDGAVVKLAGVRGPHDETHYDPRQAPLLTSADAQGRFTLGSLRPDSRYFLFVEASGHGNAYFREVRLAQGEMNIALGPELFVRGKIIHAPASAIHLGKLYLSFQQTFRVGENDRGSSGNAMPLEPVNGEAVFTAGPFYKVYGDPVDTKNGPLWERKTVGLHVDSWGQAVFSVDELPISDFVFDLAQKTNDRSAPEPDAPARQATKEGKATPKGEPSSTSAPLPPPPEAASTVSTLAPKAEVIEIHPTGEVPPSNAQATASLSGVVTATANGQPIAGAEVRLVGRTELIAARKYGLRVAANGSTKTDGQGRFTLRDLRANAVYQLCVEAQSYGAAYVAVDKLPIDEFEVKLGPERFIHGRIIHAPASLIHGGQLSLSFSQSLGEERPEKEVWKIVTLQPKDGSSDFVIGPFYLPQGVQPFSKAPVSLRVDGKDLAYFRGEDLPGTDYVLDLAPDLGPLEGEYKISPESPWTLDLRSDGTAFYYTRGERYTARYSLAEQLVTFTFPDGLQEHLQVDGLQLLGMPGNQVLPTVERLKPGGGSLDREYKPRRHPFGH